MQAQPTYWRGLLRTHVPAILAALRRAPDGGCRPVAPAEAAAQRDRACAWLGCGNPGCLNLAGASEAALPVLRCARCRWAGQARVGQTFWCVCCLLQQRSGQCTQQRLQACALVVACHLPHACCPPALRRVVGYCGPACQRAAWAHHKPACELLSRPSDEA